jgi:hypothetical protein
MDEDNIRMLLWEDEKGIVVGETCIDICMLIAKKYI